MGQWDNLDSLASLAASSSSASAPSLGGVEALSWSPLLSTIHAEFAWRHRDWSEVFSELAAVSFPYSFNWLINLIIFASFLSVDQ